MLSPRWSAVRLVISASYLLAALTSSSISASARHAPDTVGAAGLTIAVTDFSGQDAALARFISETLLTDLASSPVLHLVERTEIRRALVELKLESTGLVEGAKAQQLGKLVSADRLVVGSYLLRDDQVIVNARLLDVHTGRLVPGGAANVQGSRRELLALTHRLARLFHKRVAGTDLALDENGDPESPSGTADPAPDVSPAAQPMLQTGPAGDPPAGENVRQEKPAASGPADTDDLQRLKAARLVPAGAHGNDVLSESDLSGVITRMAARISPQTERPITLTHSLSPVTRVRAITALAKVVVSPDRIAGYRPDSGDPMRLADLEQVPSWGLPYVSAAINEGLWTAERPLRPREPATWTFMAAVLVRMPVLDAPTEPAVTTVSSRSEPRDPDACTGLIVDARDLTLQRTMGPRILDEDGNVVYPDPSHVPDVGFLQDFGMAAYSGSVDSSKRSGERPLIVRAIATAGPGHDDLVISTRAAERIREAERRGRFLHRWAVTILVDYGN